MSAHEQFADDLALYALGVLTGPEKQRLEEHLAGCADCTAELDRLRADVALLAMSTPAVRPSAAARKRLMASISTGAASVQRRGFFWWVAAPSLALLLFGFLTLALWRQNHELRRDLERSASVLQQSDAELTAARRILDVLSSDRSVRVTLVAAGQKPQPQAQAVYVPATRQMVLTASNLPLAPAGKAYQLWILPVKGAPIPSGTFRATPDGAATALMPEMVAGIKTKGFAITLEPEGGSLTPTMPILFLGSA